jgi:raffinose/stachyose/melibiose transport system permease protein
MKKKFSPNITLMMFIFPALVLYTVFVLAPAVGGVYYSLTNWNGLNPTYRYVGFSNYRELIQDTNFINSIKFTSRYVIYMVILQNGIALGLALFIESLKRGKVIFRTLYFFPNMISMIIGGFIWIFIFTRLIPYVSDLFMLDFLKQSWIGDPKYSFYSIIILSLWGGVGYLMVIYIAALQNVPMTLKEAAVIDGANKYQVFFHVVRPMITHAITIGVFIALSSSFKVFDQVYALTGGGPGRATQVVSLNIFHEAFHFQNRYGYASAKAIILFVMIAVITLIQLYFMKRREVEV